MEGKLRAASFFSGQPRITPMSPRDQTSENVHFVIKNCFRTCNSETDNGLRMCRYYSHNWKGMCNIYSDKNRNVHCSRWHQAEDVQSTDQNWTWERPFSLRAFSNDVPISSKHWAGDMSCWTDLE